MGEALRGDAGDGGIGRSPAAGRLSRAGATRARAARLVAAVFLSLLAILWPAAPLGAQARDTSAIRLDEGRFTVVAYPRDLGYARSILAQALERDTFPGLPRPQRRALIAIAPDEARFRAWVGPRAPEWGSAIAFPASGRIVLRGRGAGAAREAPRTVLRHELAHLALHEALGDLPPRWFEEGYASYAAGEWGREQMLATNIALLFRRIPPLDSLDRRLVGGEREAQGAYALSHRAVAELAELDPERGLSLLVRHWRETGRLDAAVRRAYGLTLDSFEQRWQQRTRLRYGVLGLVGNLGAAMLVMLAVIVPFVLQRRVRDRRRMAALRAADRAADLAAARELAAIAALVAAGAVSDAGDDDDREAGDDDGAASPTGRNPSLDSGFGPV